MRLSTIALVALLLPATAPAQGGLIGLYSDPVYGTWGRIKAQYH